MTPPSNEIPKTKTVQALLLLCLFCGMSTVAHAQAGSVSTAQTQVQVEGALIGEWTGVLEYRDYSEPPTSTKKVQLPTWLSVTKAPEGLYFSYVYDDGPTKTVRSQNVVVIDVMARSYKVVSTDSVAESYGVAGLEKLSMGHGDLVMTGQNTDNDKPSEVRTTLKIRRNLISWLEEVRPVGSTDAFQFRHQYVFTRASTPGSETSRTGKR